MGFDKKKNLLDLYDDDINWIEGMLKNQGKGVCDGSFNISFNVDFDIVFKHTWVKNYHDYREESDKLTVVFPDYIKKLFYSIKVQAEKNTQKEMRDKLKAILGIK